MIIEYETLPFWNSASVTFLLIVVGIVVVTLIISALVTQDFEDTIANTLGAAAIGGMVFFFISVAAYMIQDGDQTNQQLTKALEQRGYANVSVSEGEFVASKDGKYVEGLLRDEDNNTKRVVEIDLTSVE